MLQGSLQKAVARILTSRCEMHKLVSIFSPKFGGITRSSRKSSMQTGGVRAILKVHGDGPRLDFVLICESVADDG